MRSAQPSITTNPVNRKKNTIAFEASRAKKPTSATTASNGYTHPHYLLSIDTNHFPLCRVNKPTKTATAPAPNSSRKKAKSTAAECKTTTNKPLNSYSAKTMLWVECRRTRLICTASLSRRRKIFLRSGLSMRVNMGRRIYTCMFSLSSKFSGCKVLIDDGIGSSEKGTTPPTTYKKSNLESNKSVTNWGFNTPRKRTREESISI